MSGEFLLLFFGVSLLLSLIMARGATLIKTPMVVGYIVAGAILGPAILNLINLEQVKSLSIINTLTLSFIGFGVGGELKFSELKKLGKAIITVVLWEATGAFVVVAVTTGLILHNIPLGIIYGALASATAPAGTTDVIKQYNAKGNLTTTLYAVMGLDDIYALIIYTLAIPIAIIMMGGKTESGSIAHGLEKAGLEVILSLGIGSAVGFLMAYIAAKIHDRASILFFALGIILLGCFVAEKLELSPILLNMAVGIVAVNYKPIIARKVFQTLGDWSPPMYVWFFVLIGTRLNFHMILTYWILIIGYILSRTLGKWGGAFFGAKISHSPEKTVKYLGFTLLSQAGVAIGLSLAAAKSLEKLHHHAEAVQVISVMTATTFIIMLIGPIVVKWALIKAGEAKEI